MSSIRARILTSLVILTFILVQSPPGLWAQAAPPPPTPQELDQLLAPIALYPDSLLAQITTASTNPQEILDVDNWLASNPGLTGAALSNAAQQQGFDPAFIGLVQFPDVLQMMADNIDDYAAIGEAVTENQAEVSNSIQRLRAQAYAAGTLRSNAQQTVVVQQGPQPIYVIQPANPQVVYIPQYDPSVVYVQSNPGLITFGVGIGIGALIATNQPWGWGGWGWQWGHGIYYNRVIWGGWRGGYRPPHPWYRPRPIVWASRPGYRGNWHYRPRNYRPPAPISRPRPVRPGPGNRPVFTRPPSRPGNPSVRPPANRPPANRPPANNHPPANNRPPANRPPANRPPANNRPQGNNRPPTNNRPPSETHRPPSQSRPAQRPAPQDRPAGDRGRPPQSNHPPQEHQGGGNQQDHAPSRPSKGQENNNPPGPR